MLVKLDVSHRLGETATTQLALLWWEDIRSWFQCWTDKHKQPKHQVKGESIMAVVPHHESHGGTVASAHSCRPGGNGLIFALRQLKMYVFPGWPSLNLTPEKVLRSEKHPLSASWSIKFSPSTIIPITQYVKGHWKVSYLLFDHTATVLSQSWFVLWNAGMVSH